MKSIPPHQHRIVSGALQAAILLVAACGANPGGLNDAELEGERGRRLGEWQASYDEMVAALQLNPGEQTALESTFLERDRELRDWLEGPQGTRLIELESQMAEAARDRDLQAVRAATAEASPLRDRFRKLIAESENRLLSALTPEQRRAWEGHQLFTRLLELLEPVGLGEDQLRALRDAAPQFLEEARQAGEPNPPAAAFLQYERWAERRVLDPVQRGMYEDVKRENPLRSLRG